MKWLIVVSILILGTGCEKLIYQKDAETMALASVVYSADLSWSAKTSYGVEINSDFKVRRLRDTQSKGVILYPPTGSGGTILLERSAEVVLTHGSPFFKMPATSYLAPMVGDLRELVNDSFTVLISFYKAEIDATSKVLRLLELHPADGTASGWLVADLLIDDSGKKWFQVMHYMDGTNYSYRRFELTSSMLSAPVAAVIRFDLKADHLQLAINGQLGSEALVTVGTPHDLAFTARKFSLRSSAGTYGTAGSVYVGEAAIYKKAFEDEWLVQASDKLKRRWAGASGKEPGWPNRPPEDDGTDPVDPTDPNAEGAALYSTHCSGCHFALSSSAKRGRTKSQIDAAIGSIPQMSGLSILTPEERQKIANALK